MRLFIAGCVYSILLFSCKAQEKKPEMMINKDDNSLLWRVTGKGLEKPSFIFGTFHLLCKDDIVLTNQLKSFIKYADTVYMEMDLDDPSTLLGGLLFMNMKGGKKLQDFYTAEEFARLSSYFNDTLGTPIALFGKMKPYMLIAMLYPKMMDCKTPSGVEEELVKIAKEYKKDVKGLETIQFQASVFDSIPYEWQAKELLKAIDSFEVSKQEFDSMAIIYKQQQLGEMESMLKKSSLGGGEYDDLLLGNRNRNWVEQLKKLMPRKSLFVAVGAGHLVGDDGLIKLLRKAGYTVEPLKN